MKTDVLERLPGFENHWTALENRGPRTEVLFLYTVGDFGDLVRVSEWQVVSLGWSAHPAPTGWWGPYN